MPKDSVLQPWKVDGTAFVSPDELVNPIVKTGVDFWRAQCGARRFPTRADMTLRGLASVLSHCVVLGVIDGGADYEFRFVGDGHVRAFQTPFKGVRLTQIEAGAPEFGGVLRTAYEKVRAGGVPYAVRGRMDYGGTASSPLCHETAFLPLGASDDEVDHILIIGVQIPAPFWDIPKDKIARMTKELFPG